MAPIETIKSQFVGNRIPAIVAYWRQALKIPLKLLTNFEA
jgi:hypothetical protein